MPFRIHRTALFAFLAVVAIALSGCKSKYIEATLENRSGQTLSLIQVEYPSAAFGVQTLAPGQPFHYRFKLLGSGPIKVTWNDSQEHEHKQEGPRLNEGSQGTLGIAFLPNGQVSFTTSVRP